MVSICSLIILVISISFRPIISVYGHEFVQSLTLNLGIKTNYGSQLLGMRVLVDFL